MSDGVGAGLVAAETFPLVVDSACQNWLATHAGEDASQECYPGALWRRRGGQ